MVFLIDSAACLPYPCCRQGLMEPFGRRRRGQILSSGEKRWLHILCLRCANCDMIHHELPKVLTYFFRLFVQWPVEYIGDISFLMHSSPAHCSSMASIRFILLIRCKQVMHLGAVFLCSYKWQQWAILIGVIGGF